MAFSTFYPPMKASRDDDSIRQLLFLFMFCCFPSIANEGIYNICVVVVVISSSVLVVRATLGATLQQCGCSEWEHTSTASWRWICFHLRSLELAGFCATQHAAYFFLLFFLCLIDEQQISNVQVCSTVRMDNVRTGLVVHPNSYDVISSQWQQQSAEYLSIQASTEPGDPLDRQANG